MAEQKYLFNIQEKGASTVQSKMNGITRSIKSMVTAGVSIYTVKKALNATVTAAIEQEKIFRKLQTSIELTGKNYNDVKGEIDNVTASLQAMTEYGDTESAEVLTTLIQLTGNYEKSIQNLPLVLDMASTGLFDTGTAARYVAMALEGNAEALGRYVPALRASNNEIMKSGTAAEKTAEAMRILNEKFGGTAQKNLDSTSARYKQLKNYMGDIGEAIGDRALPALLSMSKAFLGLITPSAISNLEEISQKAAVLSNEFDVLTGSLLVLAEKEKLSNEESKLKSEIIGELQEKYPNYLKNINLESANYNTLATSINSAKDKLKAYTEQIIQKEIVQNYSKEIARLTMTISENEMSIVKAQTEHDRLVQTYTTERWQLEKLRGEIESLSNINEMFKAELAEVSEKMGTAIKYYNGLGAVIPPVTEDISIQTKNVEKLVEAFGYLQLKINELDTDEEIHPGGVSPEELEMIREDYIDTANTYANAFSTVISSVSRAFNALHQNQIQEINDEKNKRLEALEKQYETGIISEEKYQADRQRIIDAAQRKEEASHKKMKPLLVAEAVANTSVGVTKALKDYKWPFSMVVAGLIAAAGAIEIAAINAQKFAEGGIVGGTSYTGDRIPIAVNSGEMILNRTQQAELFDMINSGKSGNNVTINIQGDFLGSEEQADKLAKIIEDRSKRNFNRIAVK